MRLGFALLVLAAAGSAVGQDKSPGFRVDLEKKEVLVSCKVAPRKLPTLPEIYPVEVVATWAAPKGQKAHETVVNFDAKPSDIHKALESLGLKPGKPLRGDDGVATGAELELLIELPDKKRIPLESVLADRATGKPFPPIRWLFTGSSMKQLDPTKPEQTYGADLAGTLIGIYPVTDELVVQTNLSMKEEGAIKIEVTKGVLPAENTPIILVIRPASGRSTAPAVPAPTARAAAETEVLKVSERVLLTPARVAPPSIVLAPSAALADPFQLRRDVPAPRPAAEEGRPLPLPVPGFPK